eukprot:scaffold1676_cov373-Prasinococcus_capsulatus_cf.AAC.1
MSGCRSTRSLNSFMRPCETAAARTCQAPRATPRDAAGSCSTWCSRKPTRSLVAWQHSQKVLSHGTGISPFLESHLQQRRVDTRWAASMLSCATRKGYTTSTYAHSAQPHVDGAETRRKLGPGSLSATSEAQPTTRASLALAWRRACKRRPTTSGHADDRGVVVEALAPVPRDKAVPISCGVLRVAALPLAWVGQVAHDPCDFLAAPSQHVIGRRCRRVVHRRGWLGATCKPAAEHGPCAWRRARALRVRGGRRPVKYASVAGTAAFVTLSNSMRPRSPPHPRPASGLPDVRAPPTLVGALPARRRGTSAGHASKRASERGRTSRRVGRLQLRRLGVRAGVSERLDRVAAAAGASSSLAEVPADVVSAPAASPA